MDAFTQDMTPKDKQHSSPADPVPRSKQSDPVNVRFSTHSLRFVPNDSLWRKCLLGYPWSRPEIGLRGLSSRDFMQQNQCSHHEPVEQPQPESERRLHRFPDSWFLTTWAEMRIMAPKTRVSKILPLLSVANAIALLWDELKLTFHQNHMLWQKSKVWLGWRQSGLVALSCNILQGWQKGFGIADVCRYMDVLRRLRILLFWLGFHKNEQQLQAWSVWTGSVGGRPTSTRSIRSSSMRQFGPLPFALATSSNLRV